MHILNNYGPSKPKTSFLWGSLIYCPKYKALKERSKKLTTTTTTIPIMFPNSFTMYQIHISIYSLHLSRAKKKKKANKQTRKKTKKQNHPHPSLTPKFFYGKNSKQKLLDKAKIKNWMSLFILFYFFGSYSLQPGWDRYQIFQRNNARIRNGVALVANSDGLVTAFFVVVVILVKVVQIEDRLVQRSVSVDKHIVIFLDTTPFPVPIVSPVERHTPKSKAWHGMAHIVIRNENCLIINFWKKRKV